MRNVSQHPHQLHAEASLWSLRAALRHYATHREAVLLKRPQLGPPSVRPRSLRSLAEHDQVLREERAERRGGSLTGLKPSAGSAGPISPGLLDLDRHIVDTLIEAHTLLRYVHDRDPLRRWSREWHDVLADEFGVRQDARWTWISVVLPGTPTAVAEACGELLAGADRRVRSVCGLDPDQIAVPLAPECPACGQRRLRVQHSAPDSARWTIVCTSGRCWCRGDRCECGMGVRAARVPHVWAASSPLAVSLLAGLQTRTVGLAA